MGRGALTKVSNYRMREKDKRESLNKKVLEKEGTRGGGSRNEIIHSELNFSALVLWIDRKKFKRCTNAASIPEVLKCAVCTSWAVSKDLLLSAFSFVNTRNTEILQLRWLS